jgi:hypothetical protein
MAYYNNPASRLGQQNLAGDTDALFLKVFAGEVLSVFEEANVMMPLHQVRTITSGKSAQFPAVGTATATYHTPGESVLETDDGASPADTKYLSKFAHSEIVVSINDLLLSSAFIANIDEAKNHYDVRSEYTRQMGFALANQADRTLLIAGCIGARAATDRFGGSAYLGSKIDISAGASVGAVLGTDIVDGLFAAAETLDEKDVPGTDRYCVLSPNAYYKIVNENKDAINRDYGNDGNGSTASGMVMSVAGIRILKSNHLPTADYVAPSGEKNLSNTNFTSAGNRTQGLVFHRSAIGTVKLLDLAVESEYQIERQGTLMVAKYAMGHKTLRNEALVELTY